MRYVEEFRDPEAAKAVLAAIKCVVDDIDATKDDPVRIMEICGAATAAIFPYGVGCLAPPGSWVIFGAGWSGFVLPLSRVVGCVEVGDL
ncbi:MAG: hydrogenase formation protein HypD, partial [Arenibacterium sp.]